MKFIEFIHNFKYIGDGIGKNTNISDVNNRELLVGIAVEMEHTKDINRAASISLDHLIEKNNYYSLLLKSGIVDEKKAIYLGKKLLNINTEDQYDMMNPDKGMGSPAEFMRKMNQHKEINKDDEITNVLLGFKPFNVGDYVN